VSALSAFFRRTALKKEKVTTTEKTTTEKYDIEKLAIFLWSPVRHRYIERPIPYLKRPYDMIPIISISAIFHDIFDIITHL